ncbi:unnamed protein product [Prunus armeniaca]
MPDPSLTKNIGGQAVHSVEVIVTSIIAAGDLELPFRDKEDETLAEQPAIEATLSGRRNKRKEIAPVHDSVVQPETSAESPPPPSTKSKRLRKRTVVEYVATEEPATAPTTTSGTDEELREAFEAVEQEKEPEEGDVFLKEKNKEFEEEAELPVAVPESEVEVAAAVPRLVSFQVEVPKTVGILAVMTSPLKPRILAITSFADPELAKFEAMDLDAQLDKLEKLSSTPSQAKSKAVDEAMKRVKIWQSTELELDENREAVDQLMKDLDLLHGQNMAPKPILKMSLGLARDVLNLHDRYEDLKPTFKTSEFWKATHEANLADYAKQNAALDQMVAGYKEAKATVNKLDRQIEELQKQLEECREMQNKLRAGLSSKTKATFFGHASCLFLRSPICPQSDDLLRCGRFNRFGFYPFGEIVCSYNDETVLFATGWINLANEIHCPSSEWS